MTRADIETLLAGLQDTTLGGHSVVLYRALRWLLDENARLEAEASPIIMCGSVCAREARIAELEAQLAQYNTREDWWAERMFELEAEVERLKVAPPHPRRAGGGHVTDLDKEVMRVRFEYRKAWKAWWRIRNSVDVEARVAAQEQLTRMEREWLEIGKREER